MEKYPTFKFKVLNTSRVMITPGKLQYVHLSQSLAIKVSLPYNAQYHGPIQNGGTNVTMGIKYFWKESIEVLAAYIIYGVRENKHLSTEQRFSCYYHNHIILYSLMFLPVVVFFAVLSLSSLSLLPTLLSVVVISHLVIFVHIQA